MARTLQQMHRQIAALSKEAEALKRQEVAGIIDRIKEAIAIYGLTASDLGLRQKLVPKKATGVPAGRSPKTAGRGRPGVKVPVKYRDQSGNTWSGRGLQPQWLKAALQSGKRLEDFKA